MLTLAWIVLTLFVLLFVTVVFGAGSAAHKAEKPVLEGVGGLLLRWGFEFGVFAAVLWSVKEIF